MPNRASERPRSAFRQRRNTGPHAALRNGPPTEYGLLSAGKRPGGKYEQDPADDFAKDCGSKQNGLGP
jgi:hypothetical protein